MIPAMRQQLIMQHLSKNKLASINDLTELLGVSHMTIRRDIQKLEGTGRVVSVSGGVGLATQITTEPPHLDKRGMQQREKDAIARAAIEQVGDAATIYLDAGTTTLALARRMAAGGLGRDRMVVTNDLVVALFLAENSPCRQYFIGGMVNTENRSCVGEGAAKILKSLNIDVAFVSSPSWNTRWLSIPDNDKALVKKAVVASSTRRILLSDSSKYGKVGAFKAVPLSGFDMVITDEGLADAAREALVQQGVELVIAK